jgi:hypothetical protein
MSIDKSMKLLIGTLYSGEDQFEECCDAIRSQTYSDYEHLVIEHLPKKDAHDKLYTTFMDRSREFDLLVKVDADMVIEKADLFENIVAEFEKDDDLDLLLIAVHDFFTDRLIIGINIFRNTVRWEINNDHLFTDMKHITSSVRKVKKDYGNLAPAAAHCKNPGYYQAFHFGFHRGMKAVKGGTNWNILFDVIKHYNNNPDIRLAYTILGANTALDKRFSIEHISYNNKILDDYFKESILPLPESIVHKTVNNSKIVKLFNLPIRRSLIYRYYYYKGLYFK